MQYRHNQSGFSAIEIIIVVAVIAIVGFLGYTFYNNYQNNAANSPTATVTNMPSAPAISTAADLDKANAAMDETELESASSDDLAELENDLSNF